MVMINLKKIECEKNTAVLYFHLFLHLGSTENKKFDGKSVRVIFIVDDSLQEINPKICNQRVKQKKNQPTLKMNKLVKTFGIKREGVIAYLDPWGIYLFDDYMNWDNYVELEKDFPSFKKVMQIHTSGKDDGSMIHAVSASAFDEQIILSQIWQKFVNIIQVNFIFKICLKNLMVFGKLGDQNLREKIYSRDYTIGYIRIFFKDAYLENGHEWENRNIQIYV